MLTRNEYEQFERWTAYVRHQTKHEMTQLRLERARAEQPAAPRTAPFAGVRHWWQSVEVIVRGGVPALERAVLGLLTPRIRPEQMLPDATVPGR